MTYQILISDSKVIDIETSQTAFPDLDVTMETITAREPTELIDAAADADALIVDASTQVTADVLRELDSLQVVGRSGIGVDNVDIQTARDQNVTVVNVPDYCLDEVSVHALAMLLSCARKLPQLSRSVERGEWEWEGSQPIYRIQGRTVGIVGFGSIARSFAAKLRGFGVDVLVYDPYVSSADLSGFDVTSVGFERLLADSDYVSVHAPLTDDTRGIFDADAFETMPDHAILINTARGPLVNEADLIEALDSGALAGAGLDVRETEPPVDSELSSFENVILTPHVGFYSEESRRDLTRSVCEDVGRVLKGEAPKNPVELDEDWM